MKMQKINKIALKIAVLVSIEISYTGIVITSFGETPWLNPKTPKKTQRKNHLRQQKRKNWPNKRRKTNRPLKTLDERPLKM
ncbi:MAG: hypothetical protein PHX61_03130 [Alphaproteobacteria bacterium]|nr:hypothetical protein [Alphaproteobacteria bacterium]